jgi:hypothetical protein
MRRSAVISSHQTNNHGEIKVEYSSIKGERCKLPSSVVQVQASNSPLHYSCSIIKPGRRFENSTVDWPTILQNSNELS